MSQATKNMSNIVEITADELNMVSGGYQRSFTRNGNSFATAYGDKVSTYVSPDGSSASASSSSSS